MEKKKRRLVVRNRKLKREIDNKSRDEARKDFFELLKRAATTTGFRP